MRANRLAVFPIRLSKQDIEALQDRAKIEQIPPSVLLRKFLRDCLTNKSLPAA